MSFSTEHILCQLFHYCAGILDKKQILFKKIKWKHLFLCFYF